MVIFGFTVFDIFNLMLIILALQFLIYSAFWIWPSLLVRTQSLFKTKFFDFEISLKLAILIIETKLPGVDFIKVESWAFFIEIAISICALRPMPNFYVIQSFSKVGRCTLCPVPSFMKSRCYDIEVQDIKVPDIKAPAI